jgi:hypothetical protein
MGMEATMAILPMRSEAERRAHEKNGLRCTVVGKINEVTSWGANP